MPLINIALRKFSEHTEVHILNGYRTGRKNPVMAANHVNLSGHSTRCEHKYPNPPYKAIKLNSFDLALDKAKKKQPKHILHVDTSVHSVDVVVTAMLITMNNNNNFTVRNKYIFVAECDKFI